MDIIRTETKLPIEIRHTLDGLNPLFHALDTRLSLIDGFPEHTFLDYHKVVSSLLELLESKDTESGTDPLNNISSHKVHSYYVIHGELEKIHSGLSRFAAQSASGIAPITENPSHYWNHSALGLGTAVLGIIQITTHIFDTFGKENIQDRFAYLLRNETSTEDIQSDEHSIPDITKIPALKIEKPSKQQYFDKPLMSLPFFSGRDGFRSNVYSMSVPLSCIYAGTNVRWSLLNLTHELCHDVIQSVIYYIRNITRGNKTQLDYVDEILKSSDRKSIGIHIQKKFFSGFLSAFPIQNSNIHARLLDPDSDDESPIYDTLTDDAQRVLYLFKEHHSEIEELMVHALDFLYFYNSESDLYLKHIWSSWATIPGVNRRLEKYILRSLVTVSLAVEAETALDSYPFEKVKANLKLLEKDPGISHCCVAALEILKTKREALYAKMMEHRTFSEIVKFYLSSEELGSRLRKKPDEHEHFKRAGTFIKKPFENPLWLCTEFTSRNPPSFSKAVWLYNTLAFYK